MFHFLTSFTGKCLPKYFFTISFQSWSEKSVTLLFPQNQLQIVIYPPQVFPNTSLMPAFEELYMFSSIHITIILQQFVLYFLCKLKFSLHSTFLHDLTILVLFCYCHRKGFLLPILIIKTIIFFLKTLLKYYDFCPI